MTAHHRPPADWGHDLSGLLERRPDLVGIGISEISALGVMSA